MSEKENKQTSSNASVPVKERGLPLHLGLFTPTTYSVRSTSPFIRPGLTSTTLFPKRRISLLEEVAHISVQPEQTVLIPTEPVQQSPEKVIVALKDVTEAVEAVTTLNADPKQSETPNNEMPGHNLIEEDIIKMVRKTSNCTVAAPTRTYPERFTVFEEDTFDGKSSVKDTLSDGDESAIKVLDHASQSSGRSRTKTSSFCSTCSLEDSPSLISRCSICDGCSSSGLDVVSDKPRHNSPSEREIAEELCANLSKMLQLEESLQNTRSQGALFENTCKVKHGCSSDPSLTHPQTTFVPSQMLDECLLSHHAEDITEQKRVNRSQQKSIACLIQAVVILTKKVTVSSDHWLKLQTEIKHMQTEKSKYRQKLVRMKMWLFILLFLNILSVPGVRNRILALLQWFGVVRTVKNINRMRKMVSENWRNIPSMLTDFWRIFIFRSHMRNGTR